MREVEDIYIGLIRKIVSSTNALPDFFKWKRPEGIEWRNVESIQHRQYEEGADVEPLSPSLLKGWRAMDRMMEEECGFASYEAYQEHRKKLRRQFLARTFCCREDYDGEG